MSTAIITIKTDLGLKKEAMALAGNLGFSISSLFNAYLRQFVRTKKVDFSLVEEEPTDFLLRSLAESEKEIESGSVSPIFKEHKKALKWLQR